LAGCKAHRRYVTKIYKILRGFEATDEEIMFQRTVGCIGGHDLKLFKKGVNLDAGKFSFGNPVCDEWHRLPEWVVNGESVNKSKGNFTIILGIIGI